MKRSASYLLVAAAVMGAACARSMTTSPTNIRVPGLPSGNPGGAHVYDMEPNATAQGAHTCQIKVVADQREGGVVSLRVKWMGRQGKAKPAWSFEPAVPAGRWGLWDEADPSSIWLGHGLEGTYRVSAIVPCGAADSITVRLVKQEPEPLPPWGVILLSQDPCRVGTVFVDAKGNVSPGPAVAWGLSEVFGEIDVEATECAAGVVPTFCARAWGTGGATVTARAEDGSLRAILLGTDGAACAEALPGAQ